MHLGEGGNGRESRPRRAGMRGEREDFNHRRLVARVELELL